MSPVLAALSWDPQVRGFSILVIAVAILCGSVYLLLATNTGAKLGLLLALAGITGWMTLMGILWTAYGIGLKGDLPTWKVQEMVSGDVDAATAAEVDDFPRGWRQLDSSDASLADAEAAADHALAASAQEGAGEAGHGAGEAGPPEPEFEPPFQETSDYVHMAAYQTGGRDCWLPGALCSARATGDRNPLERVVDKLKRGLFHEPNHVVIQVQPAISQVSLDGAPITPQPDPSREPVTLVLVRDLGNLRLPSAVLTISMAILFGVIVNALHRRDKEIAQLQAAPA
jgi:hypothetical protein